jgi:hypothetical protein
MANGKLEGMRRIGDWKGAALDRAWQTADLGLSAWMAANFVRQAAPENVSTRVRYMGALRG